MPTDRFLWGLGGIGCSAAGGRQAQQEQANKEMSAVKPITEAGKRLASPKPAKALNLKQELLLSGKHDGGTRNAVTNQQTQNEEEEEEKKTEVNKV